MMKCSNRKYYIASFLIMLFIGCKENTSKENSSEYIPALDAIDRKITSWVDSGYYNGASVRIIKDGELLFESYYGGYTDTTSLHVASAGKWVAAATIASLVDDGKLDWNDKVKKYLPEFVGEKGDATLRQLLSHTAGYPDYQPKENRLDDYQTLEEAVSHIVNLPADTLPGTKFRYGGLAMQVVGRMAEVATGKDWETLFQEQIGKPLKMKYSHFVPVSEEPGFNPMLGGGFKTCMKDYMNFLKMILHYGTVDDNQVLSQKAIQEIEKDQLKVAKIYSENYVLHSRQNRHNGIYGLGVWREEIDADNIATLVSSPGWAGAYPWVDRKNNVYGFIIAKVNSKAFSEGFSSFYGGAVLPLMVRDAITEMSYPQSLIKGFKNIDNARLYFEEIGEGEPVILIHGHSLDHKMWNDQFFELAKTNRVIRYDLRGYGYSSPQQESVQFTHVQDLIALMDLMKISKAHIVGLSLGGYIGTDLLGLYPHRILSAVLVSGNVRHLPKPSIPMDEDEAQKRDEEIALLKTKGIDIMKRDWFNGLMRTAGTERERMRQPLWNMIYQWDAWQPLHKEARVTAGDDAFEKLKRNKPSVRVLTVEGESSNTQFLKNPEILDYLPNGKMTIIENAGHMLNMEQPKAFNETIIKFINNKEN